MAQGKLKLQANDGRVAGIVFEDGASGDVSVTVPKEGGVFLTTEGAQTKAVLAALNAKADKATTLVGYGIEDAYTKEEVNNLLLDTKEEIDGANLDLASVDFFQKTVSADTSFSLTNVPEVASFVLELTNAGAYAISWWSGIKWEKGTVPTLTASGVDILGFYTLNSGTTWRGFILAKDSK